MAQQADLTAEPMPTGFSPDNLVLERYTKEAEQLSKQAQPTNELSRNLAQSVQYVKQMTVEFSRLPEIIGGLGRALRELGQQVTRDARDRGGLSLPPSQGGLQPSTSTAARTIDAARADQGYSAHRQGGSPLVTSAVTAAIVSQVVRSSAIQSVDVTRSPIVGPPAVARKTRVAREQATAGGKSILDIINTESPEEIAKLGLPHLGSDPTAPRMKQLLEARAKKPFEKPEDVGAAVKGIGTGARGQELAEAIKGGDLQKTKPLTPMQQARADTKERISDIKEETKLLEGRDRLATSGKGANLLRQEHKLRQDMSKQRSTTEWHEMVAIHGRLGANMQLVEQQAEKLGLSFQKIGQIGTYAFFGGTAGILSMVQAANPVAFNTFKASMEGAAISIGTTLVPAVMEVSGWIQQATDWFDGLSEGTKKWVGYGIIAVPIFGGLAMVIGRLGPLLMIAGRGMMVFGRGLATLAIANPIIAITAAVVGLGAAWYFTRQKADEATDAMGRAGRTEIEAREGGRGARTAAETLSGLPDEVRRRLAGMPGGGTEEERAARTRLILSESLAEAKRREAEAERARVAALAASPEETRRERQIAETLTPEARRRFETLRDEEMRRRESSPGRRGEGVLRNPVRLTTTEITALQERAAREVETERALTTSRYATGIPSVISRITAALQGRDVETAGTAERGRPAQQALEQRRAERERIERAIREFGGAEGGTRLDTRGAFPQAQIIRTFSEFGEQIATKSLQPTGEQGALNELKRMNNILNLIGFQIGVVADNTAPINLTRMGYRPGRGG